MFVNGLRRVSAIVALAGAGILIAVLPAGADVKAGEAKFNAVCAECHDSADFEGEDLNGLRDTLRRISHGEIKHKKSVQLSDQEIADLAAYMASGGK
jgi:mono/diheme cytochrome c family protein